MSDHPASFGFLFGSLARGDPHEQSDIDVAVAFEDDQSSRSATRLEFGTDLALSLGTDDVDVVNLKTAPPSLVCTVFRGGDRLVGSETEAHRLRAMIFEGKEDNSRSAAERFDDALAAINDHLA